MSLETFLKTDEPKQVIPYSDNEIDLLEGEYGKSPWTIISRLIATIRVYQKKEKEWEL